ncbi:extracellular solute-binding protein [Microbacterium sp. NPDC089695]|uniref:extracellular solute-binding protein n=1 Tax=Microbacterium sp. NPDC089695 TaxID=3364198 RepID=UPI0038133FA0
MTLVLRGMTWEHERGHGSIVAASTAYEQAAPGVRIDWTFRSLQAFADAPVEQLAREFDLLVIDHPHIPLAADGGALAPLDGGVHDEELRVLAGQSVGPSHESYRYGGRQYGLASDAAAQVAVRRPDLLAEPPTDWDDVMRLARDGRVLWAAKPIDSYSSLLTLAANNGTPAFAEPGLFLSPDHAAPVLERMRELAAAVPAFCLDANPIDIAEALCADDTWSYSPLAFGYTNYSRAGYRRVRLAYTDIPRGPRGVRGSLLGGAGIAVSAHSTHPREAADFAVWVASASAQSGAYFDGGGQPGNAEAWDDERIGALSEDFFRGTRATLDGAWVRPRVPGYIAFQDTTSPWVTQMLRGELAPGTLIDRMNVEADRMERSR